MTIHHDDDLARIEALRHRHTMNPRPEDEHWRDIDALLAELDCVEREQQEQYEELESENSGLRDEIYGLQQKLDNLREQLGPLARQAVDEILNAAE